MEGKYKLRSGLPGCEHMQQHRPPKESKTLLSTRNGWIVKEMYRTTIRLDRVAPVTISTQQSGAWHHD